MDMLTMLIFISILLVGVIAIIIATIEVAKTESISKPHVFYNAHTDVIFEIYMPDNYNNSNPSKYESFVVHLGEL